MTLHDKFAIIENHINQENKKNITTKIESYFENFLNSDMKVLISDYINQVIWFNNINLEDIYINIDSQLKSYLIQRRNGMRVFIKKENFEFSSLNMFLKKFISKLEYLNNILKSPDNKVMKDGTKHLVNLIISDSLIFIFIEEQIVLLDKSLITEIRTLISTIKQLSKYDNFETYKKIITTFANIFIKQIVDMEELPLPENIKRIQKFNETIKLCQRVNLYFKFMGDNIDIINCQLYTLVIKNLLEIIKNNSLDEIKYVLKHTWVNINILITKSKFDNKTELLENISTGIIYLIEKSVEFNDYENIYKIVNIFKYIELIIKHCVNKNIINQKICSIFSSDYLLDNIHICIDSLIRKSKDKDVIKLIAFMTEVKNKDIFIMNYYKNLIKRLMEKISEPKKLKEYIDIEKNIYNFLKSKFGIELVYKINKVITDTEVSFEDNTQFNKISSFENIMTVITTSFNNWDVNQNEGILSLKAIDKIKNTKLGSYINSYNKYYNSRYSSKRILNWFPHFGEINITFLKKEIIMLPIQFMVLEMFNDVNKIPVKDIIVASFFSNYTSKFTNDIVSSLVLSGLFKVIDNNMILTSNDSFNTNLIEVFFSNSDYVNIWEQQRKDEIVLSRNEIICANINHQLKIQPMTKDQLFKSLVQTINVFELDETTFNKSIDYMCKSDYIKINDTIYEKIIYSS
jgi:hypothetical protein